MAIDDNTLYGLKGSQIKELPGKIEAVKGKARVLTTADYNWPVANPDGLAWWLLAPGMYVLGDRLKIYYSSASSNETSAGNTLVVLWAEDNWNKTLLRPGNNTTEGGRIQIVRVNNNGGAVGTSSLVLTQADVVNALTSTSTTAPLSAAQGKALKDLIDAITSFSYEVVQTLPASGQNGKIYLLPIDESGGPADNVYEEYIWVNNAWEMIGTTEMDLSNYVTFTDLNTELADYTPTANLATVATSGDYDDLADKPVIKQAGAPITSTVGTKGQLLEDTTNGKLYQCTDVSGNTYTWTLLSTSNITSRTSASTITPVQNLDLAGDPSNNKPYALKSVANGNEQSWGYIRGSIASGGSGLGTAYAGVYSYDGNEDLWESAESRLALSSDLDGRVKQNTGAPTTATVGAVGQLLEDTTNGKLYICTAIAPGTAPDPDTYTWEEVSGGPTVVQTTGASTTDVMSQNAVTDLIYTDDTYYKQIAIGTDAQTGDASTGNAYSVAIGASARAGTLAGSSDNAAVATAIGSSAVARGKYGTAVGAYSKAAKDGSTRADGCVSIGSYAYSLGTALAIGGGTAQNYPTNPNIAKASYAAADGAVAIGVGAIVNSNSGHKGSIALGAGATVFNKNGVMNIGTYDTSYGYSNSFYRLLTGLYDPQAAHDAATKGYCDNAIINGGTTAPTSSTAGAVGTQYTYVDTTGTPTAHLCVCTEIDTTDPSNPVYTWQTLI